MVFPVCSPALLMGKKRLALAALKEQKLLHEESRQWWAEWLEQAGVTGVDSSRGPKFQNTHLALQAAEAGQGFALGDNLLTADAIAEGPPGEAPSTRNSMKAATTSYGPKGQRRARRRRRSGSGCKRKWRYFWAEIPDACVIPESANGACPGPLSSLARDPGQMPSAFSGMTVLS